MNKRNVEEHMDKAVAAIKQVFPNGDVDRSMRSKMSAFGAAVMMSGKGSALAYYLKNEEKIIEMIYKTYPEEETEKKKANDMFSILERKQTDDLLERSVALKLALNLFITDKKD